MADTEHPGAQETEPAPFPRRLAARLLDLALALGLTFVVVVPLVLLALPVLLPMERGSRAYDTAIGLLASLAYFLSYVLLEWFLLVRRDGQTLGKGLLGLRVVDGRSGAALGVTSSFLRLLVLFAPFVLLSVAGGDDGTGGWDGLAPAGVLVLLVSLVLSLLPAVRHRALHDLAARSRVVRAPRRGIRLKQDLRMMVPGRVDLTKR
ncbi:hypothetical protein NUM3379_20000 [Kineococcus sp. NUM-3379]